MANYKGSKGIINLSDLTIGDAFATGGGFETNFGRYNGNWYQAPATDKNDNDYIVIWTDVNWDAEDGADACDWDNPDYILDDYGYCFDPLTD